MPSIQESLRHQSKPRATCSNQIQSISFPFLWKNVFAGQEYSFTNPIHPPNIHHSEGENSSQNVVSVSAIGNKMALAPSLHLPALARAITESGNQERGSTAIVSRNQERPSTNWTSRTCNRCLFPGTSYFTH